MGRFIDGGFVPENDPMFNGSCMMFSIRRPISKPEKPAKTYYILIDPDYAPRGPGLLGAIISRHYSMTAALDAQDRVHREALEPITTSVYSAGVMPRVQEYLGAEASVHVRTILKDPL